MDIAKLKIIGSGFTEEEYRLYRFDRLAHPDEAMRYLSNRLNNERFRPRVNASAQKSFLEDKWVMQLYFAGLGIPVPEALGLFHPMFGMTAGGGGLKSADDFLAVLEGETLPLSLVMKPRGGRQGRHIVAVRLERDAQGRVQAWQDGTRQPFDAFIAALPQDVFGDYGGGYHGWLVQKYIVQHPFMLQLNPHTVNTFRIVTFIDSQGACKIHLAVLRLGRKGSTADNWDKGGIAVAVDKDSGTLGQGVFKPSHGGAWVDRHPDTGVMLEGLVVPRWQEIVDICRRAALSLSGITSVGWDVALTPDGPVIIEGNAIWSLPLSQVHSGGYLTDDVRADLAALGVEFPRRTHSVGRAAWAYIVRQCRASRLGRLLRAD